MHHALARPGSDGIGLHTCRGQREGRRDDGAAGEGPRRAHGGRAQAGRLGDHAGRGARGVPALRGRGLHPPQRGAALLTALPLPSYCRSPFPGCKGTRHASARAGSVVQTQLQARECDQGRVSARCAEAAAVPGVPAVAGGSAGGRPVGPGEHGPLPGRQDAAAPPQRAQGAAADDGRAPREHPRRACRPQTPPARRGPQKVRRCPHLSGEAAAASPHSRMPALFKYSITAPSFKDENWAVSTT